MKFALRAPTAIAAVFVALGIGHGIGYLLGSIHYELIKEAQAITAPTSMVLGTGAIAEDCQRQFVDPTAQTACEVYRIMAIEDGNYRKFVALEDGDNMILKLMEQQERRIAELKFRLDTVECGGQQ